MVAVVTDSASNVPPEVVEELGIPVVPLSVRLGQEEFADGFDSPGGDLYERLLRDGGPASTSAPSPGAYLDAYRAAGSSEVVSVTLAGKLSAAYQEAVLAAGRFDGRVEVIDSGSASMGEGFVAIEAARAARSGASIEDVAARARDVAGRVRLYGAIETFEFLRRSGRVTKLQAYAGTMLDIKPLFRLSAGEIGAVARPRTRGKAMARLAAEVEREAAGRPTHVAALHGRAGGDARALLDRIAERTEVVERYVVPSTAAIGVHSGPGLVGVAFYCD